MDKMLPALLVVAVVLVAGYFMFMKGGDVSSGQARQLVQAGARLVDVRTPGEFAAGHIAGAVNIPVQVLEARMNELKPKDAAIVVYCRSGHRSGNAARILKSAGFESVHDLGPMSRWSRSRAEGQPRFFDSLSCSAPPSLSSAAAFTRSMALVVIS